MAWMRMMGAESVAYHRETVLGRADDYPGAALGYYASRGETPMHWGGAGAERLGLSGTVRDDTYEAIFGPGGAIDPALGVRLANTKRPGMELVVAAHKSVALLGLIGRAEDMHELLDVERDATLAYLDELTRRRGGRRGRASRPAATSGLVYAHTRHATSRAGDPAPHDHVLIANVVEMLDEAGGWKAADTALWRAHLHAATAIGRTAAARRAVGLGYAIEPDPGVSGRLGHWRIAGMPVEAEELFSKRAAEIAEAVAEAGFDSYRARGVTARTTRKVKRFTPVADLMARWRVELAGIGLHPADLIRSVDRAAADRPAPPSRLTDDECRRLVEELVAGGGPLARRKVFSRRDVVVPVSARVFGRDPAELRRVVDAVLRDPGILPLIGVAGASERAYACASVIAIESAIAAAVAKGVVETGLPVIPASAVDAAITHKETELRGQLTHGQARAVRGICGSGRRVDLVVGVAGSGKTAALACVRDAYQAAGYRVVGTSTSGQAARTLGREAGIAESRTLASLLWHLDHGRLTLDNRTVVVLDEAGMTADQDLLRVLVAAEAVRAKVVLVGDDRQLGPVGPGGALGGLIDRAQAALHLLDENVRQADRAERRALNWLRAGDVDAAVAW